MPNDGAALVVMQRNSLQGTSGNCCHAMKACVSYTNVPYATLSVFNALELFTHSAVHEA